LGRGEAIERLSTIRGGSGGWHKYGIAPAAVLATSSFGVIIALSSKSTT
jgi:hypothetical protein